MAYCLLLFCVGLDWILLDSNKTISTTMSLQKLHSRLYILSKPTKDLVSQYLSDLAQLQPRDDNGGGGGGGEEEETFGMLHFSVAYLKDKSTLEVDVIQAVDLPALDRDGMLSYLHCITTHNFLANT